MNFIRYTVVFIVLSIGLTAYSQSGSKPEPKSALQICAEKKLKDFRVRNLVSISDEPVYIEKFKQVCAKEQIAANSDKQAADAAARAEKDKKVVAAPTKPASADQTTVQPTKPAPHVGGAGTSAPSSSAGRGSGGFVTGGCGGPAECEAFMAESARVKYKWSSPALQAYLGELWGNNFDYASSLGGTYEQPENICTEKNQGEIIAFDMGTEIKPIACMSNKASQEEIKKMAEKIKNVKIDTLPVVVAVKRAKYEWKVITEAAELGPNGMRFCTGSGSCSSDNVGKVFDQGNGCAVFKCIRIDGGPVKTVKKEEKKEEKIENPIVRAEPKLTVENTRDPAQANPVYQGFDPDRDGAAGP